MRSNKIKRRYIILIALLLIVVLANIFNKNNEYLYKYEYTISNFPSTYSNFQITNLLTFSLKIASNSSSVCYDYNYCPTTEKSYNINIIVLYTLFLLILELKNNIKKDKR